MPKIEVFCIKVNGPILRPHPQNLLFFQDTHSLVSTYKVNNLMGQHSFFDWMMGTSSNLGVDVVCHPISSTSCSSCCVVKSTRAHNISQRKIQDIYSNKHNPGIPQVQLGVTEESQTYPQASQFRVNIHNHNKFTGISPIINNHKFTFSPDKPPLENFHSLFSPHATEYSMIQL